LGHAQRRVAEHGHFAVAPHLLGQPLDHVGSVLAILGAPGLQVPLGVARAARVSVDDGVTVLAPVGRVRSLEFGHLRDRVRRDAVDVPVLVGTVARPLPIPAPCQNRREVRDPLRPVGAVDVEIDLRPVPQHDGNILIDADAVLDIGARIQWRIETGTVDPSLRSGEGLRVPVEDRDLFVSEPLRDPDPHTIV
jgi:hypothetical protein